MGVPIYEENLSRQKWGALQIANWKDNKVLLSESSNTMVLQLVQKMGSGAITSI
jgi:hypothetical protein